MANRHIRLLPREHRGPRIRVESDVVLWAPWQQYYATCIILYGRNVQLCTEPRGRWYRVYLYDSHRVSNNVTVTRIIVTSCCCFFVSKKHRFAPKVFYALLSASRLPRPFGRRVYYIRRANEILLLWHYSVLITIIIIHRRVRRART